MERHALVIRQAHNEGYWHLGSVEKSPLSAATRLCFAKPVSRLPRKGGEVPTERAEKVAT